MSVETDTIFAVASARGRGGVAVLRISGPLSHWAVSQFCRLPELRVASLRWLTVGTERIDQALVIVFPEGGSFTGEQSAELHLHGSVAVVSKMMNALGSLSGLRLAEAGEFTRRAMDNGRLDLTQVEGLADLIDAETEAQRKQAVAVLSGALGKRVEPWRNDLIHAMALIEAMIDFADEDIPDNLLPDVCQLIFNTVAQMQGELHGSEISESIRDGFEVAVIGVPNSGKSTLLNAIAKRDIAITSEIAGTTRDIIELRMDIAGFAVTILDTAGIHDSADMIEQIGIQKAIARAEAADLRLFLLTHPDEALPVSQRGGDIVVLGKADLYDWGLPSVSGVTGVGVDTILEQIAKELSSRTAGAKLFIRARHKESLRDAIAALTPVRDIRLAQLLPFEVIAFHLQSAVHSLEILLGRVGVEDVLADIYSRFCVGK
jgi:tRNA modification GTPase